MNPTGGIRVNRKATKATRAWLVAPLLVLGWAARPAQALQAPGDLDPAAVQYLQVFQGYLELVERFVILAGDPTASGVAAVLYADELLKDRGPAAGIQYFTEMLPQVKNGSVERAIRFQLAELYKNNNQPDRALEEMRKLITGAPPEAPLPPPPGGYAPPQGGYRERER